MRVALLLEEEVLTTLTREDLARELDVPIQTLDAVLTGAPVSPELATALGRFFNTDPRDWMQLQ